MHTLWLIFSCWDHQHTLRQQIQLASLAQLALGVVCLVVACTLVVQMLTVQRQRFEMAVQILCPSVVLLEDVWQHS